MVTRAQLLALGVSRRQIERWLAIGRLIAVHRGAYLLGHRAVSPWAPEMAAVLACGSAAISHRSAGGLWRLVPRPARFVELTLLDSRTHGRPGIRIHRQLLEANDLRKIKGIPVTGPACTLLDLGAILDHDDYECAAAEAWARRLVTRRELAAVRDRRPRSPGAATLRALLELDRDPARTRSKAERRLLRLIRASGLPEPETNVNVGPHEVDVLWRAQRLVVEFDSWTFHSSRSAFERDRRKDAELLASGYRVLRVTWRRLTHEPESVIALLERALGGLAH